MATNLSDYWQMGGYICRNVMFDCVPVGVLLPIVVDRDGGLYPLYDELTLSEAEANAELIVTLRNTLPAFFDVANVLDKMITELDNFLFILDCEQKTWNKLMKEACDALDKLESPDA